MNEIEQEIRAVLPPNPRNGQRQRVAHFPKRTSLGELTLRLLVPEAEYEWTNFLGCWELRSGSAAVEWPRKVYP
jgi:hypothetical protein